MDNLYSIMHRQFTQMRGGAKANGKYVPTVAELRELVRQLNGMECPCCLRAMTWRKAKGESNSITLQHDHSGRIRLICFRCNMRHSHYPQDSFYDLPLAVRQNPSNKTTAVKIYKADYEWLVRNSQPGFPLYHLVSAMAVHWLKLTDRQKLNAFVACHEARRRKIAA